ncbi:Uncharacterised protein [Mycobacteroides abscessus subsp. abscessus]|nr:Uncharacterised protein [Mycobacteroides abscessus subsp. abscessus]
MRQGVPDLCYGLESLSQYLSWNPADPTKMMSYGVHSQESCELAVGG